MASKWLRAIPAVSVAGLVGVAAYDLAQKKHAILRNFPVVGHARYLLEAVGPELRQYIVSGNDEERPFSRNQRRWIYSSAKLRNNYFGFGADNDTEFAQGCCDAGQMAGPWPRPAEQGRSCDELPAHPQAGLAEGLGSLRCSAPGLDHCGRPRHSLRTRVGNIPAAGIRLRVEVGSSQRVRRRRNRQPDAGVTVDRHRGCARNSGAFGAQPRSGRNAAIEPASSRMR
ncbi:hypothetical protein SAMN05421642_109116 [Rhodococcoides kyotonense]|uniref:Uncharacterized protein n=1 Tax=Rhodococcoides kyotonense TaxID=398843 RepID=A0A239JWW7_9NOCA|nr:hypothetical protein SAMN05421642_109116 [Rhodococcus kyotonensis]